MIPRIFQRYQLPLKIALVIIFFILLSLIFTRPLAFNLSTHIAGNYGDNMGFIWMIGWFKQALFDLHQIPIKSHLLNFPYGYNLYSSEIAPLQILIALPFTLVGGPVLGYNISILSTFVLAGLCMFYWVYSKTKSMQAGLVIGTAFAICPFHMAHFLTGHLNISAIQWFPLFFMGFFGILENNSYSKKNILLTSIGLGLISLSSIYFAYMTLVLTAIILLYYVFKNRKTILKDKVFWKQLLQAGAISLPFLIISIGPYIYLHIASGMQSRELAEVSFYSASPTDFLLPSTMHPLWGEWVGAHFPRNIWTDATLYLGLPIIGLFVWNLLKVKKPPRNYLQYLCFGAIIAAILALGTNLTWLEKPVLLTAPSWLTGIFGKTPFPIYLPGYLFFRLIPFYGRMRVWMRYGIFVMVFVCAGAGLAFAKVLENKSNITRLVIFMTAMGLVILDFSVKPFPLSVVQPRKVDEWLSGQPWGGLMQLPFDQSYDKLTMYYTLTNQKGLIGYIKEVPSYRYFRLQADLKNFPDKTSIDSIRTEKIKYVLIDESNYTVDGNFISICQSYGLIFSTSIDGQSVFIIDDAYG